uniref:Uncharacterized protein n=1 Tax=Magallana gigas TaxID=29159 RepID=K1QY55_MAGGI
MTGRRPPKDVAWWDQVKQFLRETETVVSYTWGVIQSPPMGGAIGLVPCTDPRGSSKWEAATCFCKTTPSNFTRHRCTPEPFYEGSLDFHGGQSGVVEYDKQFSSPPLRKIIGGANFKKERGPWWDSITSCKETDLVTSVRNYTLVWTRVSRRSVIEWTSSLDQSGSSSTKGTPVWCVSVSNNSGGLSTHLEDCLTLLPSLCQDAHGTAIAALAALFATALLASFGLLGVVIYYRRQRNQERHRRLQETYVTPSSGYLPKPELETPYYTSLQYIANPHS